MSLLDLAPPHSVEAEQGVIGGLMLDNSTWDLIADVLSADDFFRRDHRLIYQANAGQRCRATSMTVLYPLTIIGQRTRSDHGLLDVRTGSSQGRYEAENGRRRS
jgi:replicative DNA helicase